jgi:hypothetical protein
MPWLFAKAHHAFRARGLAAWSRNFAQLSTQSHPVPACASLTHPKYDGSNLTISLAKTLEIQNSYLSNLPCFLICQNEKPIFFYRVCVVLKRMPSFWRVFRQARICQRIWNPSPVSEWLPWPGTNWHLERKPGCTASEPRPVPPRILKYGPLYSGKDKIPYSWSKMKLNWATAFLRSPLRA